MALVFMRRSSRLGLALLKRMYCLSQISSYSSSTRRYLTPMIDARVGYPRLDCYNRSPSFLRCFGSIKAQEELLTSNDDEIQVILPFFWKLILPSQALKVNLLAGFGD